MQLISMNNLRVGIHSTLNCELGDTIIEKLEIAERGGDIFTYTAVNLRFTKVTFK
jgi:hypothetical protein